MSEIININSAYPVTRFGPGALPSDKTVVRSTDPLRSMPPEAAVAARGVEESSFRIAWTHAIRSEIERGTYETEERVDVTVSRLFDLIG